MVGSSSTSAMRRAMATEFCHLSSPPLPHPASGRAPRAREMTLPNPIQGGQGEETMDASTAPRRTFLQLVGDMAELVAKAFFGGLAAAVAMGAAILALSSNTQAATLNETRTGELLLRTDTAG